MPLLVWFLRRIEMLRCNIRDFSDCVTATRQFPNERIPLRACPCLTHLGNI